MKNNLSLPFHPNCPCRSICEDRMQKLVIHLIKEDLRCSKLVLGLSGLGIDAGKYHTELSNIIFSLAGLDINDDALLGTYFDCIDKVTEVEDVEEKGLLQGMAERVLARLMEDKERRQM